MRTLLKGRIVDMKSEETMNYLSMLKGTVLKMNQETFAQWKDTLVGQYIVFSVIAPDKIDQEIMVEKLYDYFEKAELKNGKPFEKFVEVYFSNLDAIVAGRVAKAPQQRKKDEAPLPMPRARKYYEKAQEIRKGELNLNGMIDYTRIMMCLYAAIIKNKGKEIQNFDFATSSLKIDDIILAMKEEQDALPFNVIKKKKFNTDDPYGVDVITFILAIILLYKITGENFEGENENE